MFTRNLATIIGGAALALAALSTASAQTPFVITNVRSGLALDVLDASTAPGTPIQQWTPNGTKAQQWTLRRYKTTSYYELVSVNSGLVLSAAAPLNGALMSQLAAQGTPTQLWMINRPASATHGFEITSSQQVLAPGSCSSPRCLATYINLVLDDPDSATTLGTSVWQYYENDTEAQQWLFKGSTYGVTVANTGGSLVLSGFGFKPGMQICPVIEGWEDLASGCTTAQQNTTFSYTFGSSGFTYVGTGNLVIMVNDYQGNVLAIENVTGGVLFNAPK